MLVSTRLLSMKPIHFLPHPSPVQHSDLVRVRIPSTGTGARFAGPARFPAAAALAALAVRRISRAARRQESAQPGVSIILRGTPFFVSFCGFKQKPTGKTTIRWGPNPKRRQATRTVARPRLVGPAGLMTSTMRLSCLSGPRGRQGEKIWDGPTQGPGPFSRCIYSELHFSACLKSPG